MVEIRRVLNIKENLLVEEATLPGLSLDPLVHSFQITTSCNDTKCTQTIHIRSLKHTFTKCQKLQVLGGLRGMALSGCTRQVSYQEDLGKHSSIASTQKNMGIRLTIEHALV